MKKVNIFSILFLLIFFGIAFLIFSSGRASAAVEVSGGCRDTLMVYNTPLPRRMYNVNDVVNFSGKFKSAGSSSGSFFNKISFYITADKDISVRDCCGNIKDECSTRQTCDCEDGYINYYGASSSFYEYPTHKNVRWSDEVKFLEETSGEIYKIGTVYPSDTLYGDPWVAYNQSFIVPDDLGFSGQVRFYVQYSGTHWTEYWQWSVTYQDGWINENKPPYVDFLELNGTPSYCGAVPGKGMLGLKWTYQDDEGDKQSEYNIQIATNSNFSEESLAINSFSSFFDGDPSGSINTSPFIAVVASPNPDNFEIGYNNDYWWRVRVKDENGYWSQWKRGPEFSTPIHGWPQPKFKWVSEEFSAGQIISFIDNNSKCYREDGSGYNCREGGSNVRYEWDFDYEPLEGFTTDSNKKGPDFIYPEGGQYVIKLRIVDEAGMCSTTSNIEIQKGEYPPPGFKPTVPSSSLLEKFLSQVSAVFLLD